MRSVGVSNFGVDHLDALKEHKRAMPAVNQFELHPLIATVLAPPIPAASASRSEGRSAGSAGSVGRGRGEDAGANASATPATVRRSLAAGHRRVVRRAVPPLAP